MFLEMQNLQSCGSLRIFRNKKLFLPLGSWSSFWTCSFLLAPSQWFLRFQKLGIHASVLCDNSGVRLGPFQDDIPTYFCVLLCYTKKFVILFVTLHCMIFFKFEDLSSQEELSDFYCYPTWFWGVIWQRNIILINVLWHVKKNLKWRGQNFCNANFVVAK